MQPNILLGLQSDGDIFAKFQRGDRFNASYPHSFTQIASLAIGNELDNNFSVLLSRLFWSSLSDLG